MKFGEEKKSTTVNRFALHRNITHLAVITQKTNIKLSVFKGGNWKRALSSSSLLGCYYMGPSRSREVILQDLARILQDSFKEDASL